VTFDSQSKPRRKKDPDGTEYLWSPGVGRYIKCAGEPDPPEVVVKKREKRKQKKFAMIPLWWSRRANEDCGEYGSPNIHVCAELVHRAWKAKGESFVMPRAEGVSRKAKTRSLRGLETAGLIRVQWRVGRSPVVTCTEPVPWRKTE
jgi:hypothetical protein